MITPDFNAIDLLTSEKQEALKGEILKEVKFVKLTGDTERNVSMRVYGHDLSAYPFIHDRVT